MGDALWKDVAVFQQVSAQSVDALGALTHQEIAGSKHDAVRLLLFGLDRNKAHAGALRRFTDGLGIRRIVLLPLDEWLDVGWRHQSNGMTQLADLSCPVVRAGTGFHRDDAGRLCREKGNELPASNALAEQNLAGGIGPMCLEHVLRDVQPDRGNLRHGRLLSVTVRRRHLGTLMPSGGVHPVPSAASGKQKSYASQAGPPVGSDQASTSCLEHHDGTCAPTGWPRRMPSRKSRHRAPVQGSAGVMAARAQYWGGLGWLRRRSPGLLVLTGGQRSIRPACSVLKAASLGNESSHIAARVCPSWPTGSFR